MSESSTPVDTEIIFGLVSPVGTDDKRIIDTLCAILDGVRYKHEVIRLSDSLNRINGLQSKIITTNEFERITSLMNKGNELRSVLEDGAALASASILQIQEFRKLKQKDKSKPVPRQAYVLKSLKHPKEVELLRQIYGKSFWLISVYSPEETRKEFLGSKIKEKKFDSKPPTKEVDELIRRDQEESDDYGQSVRRTFPLGDVFIDANLDTLEEKMNRFVKIAFGYPYHTPSLDEYGMYLAQASALMSSSLARQVGAAIMGVNGSVFSTGTNEVPSVDGGVCNEDFGNRFREYEKGHDSNDYWKKHIVGNFLNILKDNGWLDASKRSEDINTLVNEVLTNPTLKDAQLLNMTEFGREVHAEMTALMEAARKTISVKGSTLYCTTFPCHVCAKHIIAAGIRKVIFIEPYRKSLADDLFGDFISIDKELVSNDKIAFNSFVGVAPRKYIDVFKWPTRKQKNNDKLDWDPQNANPRFGEEPLAISNKEDDQVTIFMKKMAKKNLSMSG